MTHKTTLSDSAPSKAPAPAPDGADGTDGTDRNDNRVQVSFLNAANAEFIENLQQKFRQDPGGVGDQWRQFFAGLNDPPAVAPSWRRPPADAPSANHLDHAAAASDPAATPPVATPTDGQQVRAATLDSVRAIMMIRAYRVRGHLAADLDPLRLEPSKSHPELDPETYGFSPADRSRPIFIDNVLGLETASVDHMLDILKRTYCGTLAVEFMHIADIDEKSWIQRRIEGDNKAVSFTPEGKKAILQKLIEAEGFEKFLNVKYTGTKRFGLDGGEAAIPAIEQIIKRGGALGVNEVILGMPHRGRLNVLGNVMGKPRRAIFNEFQGGSSSPEDVEGSGDVKYHLGTSSDREFDGNRVHLSLTANPSHLEIVDPVVLGKARAKQDQAGDDERAGTLPLLMHGDAAFAGQGVVAECFGLSSLKGHKSGGAIHFIVNNQIGFTTAPRFARSSPYPSDVAKMVQAPILHVNGDDPEAVVHAARLAIEFRQTFHKPVVIDMFCYRRFGHNEGDEPMFTQPTMYRAIKSHPTVLQVYADRLIAEGLMTRAEVDARIDSFRRLLEEEFAAASTYIPNKADWLDGKWAGLERATGEVRRGNTAVSMEILQDLGGKLTHIPEKFDAHKTLRRVMAARQEAVETGAGVDWATAESLAFATLLKEGYPVRLSGQDCERGTFSQRHSVLVDQQDGSTHVPLNSLGDGQARYEVVNSMLSEAAVLGFEYGYSLAEPNVLVLWEAQFGDFANGAQVVIDQFISSGEAKWLRMSGLVMLLPHGYEGQGPEHSSARLERYLQLCAEDNMQVANCTTPMNYFHVLRRQMHRDFRKPLILMTPKSLLRHKRCVSRLEEMGPGSSFHRLLWDDAQSLPGQGIALAADKKIRRVVLCSGKVYYDLYEEREKRKIDNVYLLRVEQLFPVPFKALREELSRFSSADVVWCQEEPENMGAWRFMEPHLEAVLSDIGAKAARPRYAGRPASASTAVGQMSQHQSERDRLIAHALTGN